ncbi:hypothetical protein [Nocardia sp. A7]|uniref:hypothetical protein n=1 Tax=Nocardia sp. A7 TaxID=2789274 RepID=UPI00397B8F18
MRTSPEHSLRISESSAASLIATGYPAAFLSPGADKRLDDLPVRIRGLTTSEEVKHPEIQQPVLLRIGAARQTCRSIEVLGDLRILGL